MSHKKEFPSRRRQDLLAGALLAIFICACNFAGALPKAASQPDMTVWRETGSPLFPLNWPPTLDTAWASYAFAYGSNPATLIDGNYVTSPLSKTEWKRGTSTTTVLSSDMKQAAVQGVVPLDEQASTILNSGSQVSAYCMKITALPDPTLPETKDMLAYYQTWFKYNGAFLDLIRNDHADFIKWVEQSK